MGDEFPSEGVVLACRQVSVKPASDFGCGDGRGVGYRELSAALELCYLKAKGLAS